MWPKNVHLLQVPKWCWCCWMEGHTGGAAALASVLEKAAVVITQWVPSLLILLYVFVPLLRYLIWMHRNTSHSEIIMVFILYLITVFSLFWLLEDVVHWVGRVTLWRHRDWLPFLQWNMEAKRGYQLCPVRPGPIKLQLSEWPRGLYVHRKGKERGREECT